MLKIFLLLVAASCTLSATAQHEHGDTTSHADNPIFDSIKQLAGEWHGNFKWTGGQERHGQMDAKYYLTGNGSAVVEDLLAEGKPVMTSVYHLDGNDLRVTHYCGAGNQPRLKAGAYDSESKSIKFEFIDITNLRSPDAPHVHGLELKFTDSNHIIIIFTFMTAKGDRFEEIDLTRST